MTLSSSKKIGWSSLSLWLGLLLGAEANADAACAGGGKLIGAVVSESLLVSNGKQMQLEICSK